MLLKIFILLIPTVFSIDNTRPRIDTKGQLMDVHDGNVIKYNNTYYWYGMGYTNCTLEKGVKVPVLIARESKEIVLEVTF